MKRKILALAFAVFTSALVGCAERQPQMLNTQQLAQEQSQQTSNQEQVSVQQTQQQEGSFFADIIKTATETIADEAKYTIKNSIREAGSSIRN